MARTKKSKTEASPFLGRWVALDEWDTAVVLEITKRGKSIRVKAIDSTDGEEAEVYKVRTTNRLISFGTLWSSGQFTKYRLKTFGEDGIEVNFTYTDTMRFKRLSSSKQRSGKS